MKNKLFITAILIVFGSIVGFTQQINPILSVDALKMINTDKNWVVLDVRTPGEFNQGHVKGAVNIDVSQPDAFDKYLKLNRNAKYIVYCRTRNRSGVVTNYMAQNGFKTIYQITDGIVGWNANNLPLVK
jgi:rhodanese-related sulfurtransferase